MIFNEENSWLIRFNNTIEEMLRDRGSIDNKLISEKLGVSERQLYRKLKHLKNQTPNIYIRNYRLLLAKRYLINGTFLTIKEVSYAVGYTNVGHFQRLFEQLFNKKPAAVLKEYGWR